MTFDRVATTYGDPAAEDTLSRDVASTTTVDTRAPMARYLAARTAFFDRVVVGALDRGIRQVVVAAAGYDGRALRYAKDGVRWIELDHPDTQADKLERLDRLGLATDHVAYAAADFTTDDVAGVLRTAGVHPSMTTLVLCEGVAVYLERAVLHSLLAALRSVVPPGSRLAISLSVTDESGAVDARRARFRAGVAALGEPARTVLTAAEAVDLLTSSGWTPDAPADGNERARRAGLVLAAAT